MKKNKLKSLLAYILIAALIIPQVPVSAFEIERSNSFTEISHNEEETIKESGAEENTTEGEVNKDNLNDNLKDNLQESVVEEQGVEKNTVGNTVENVYLQDEKQSDISQSFSDEKGPNIGEIYNIKSKAQSYSLENEPITYEREEFIKKQPYLVDTQELETKTDASYEIALAHSDGTYSFLDSTDSSDEAIELVDQIQEISENSSLTRTRSAITDDEDIPVVINSDGVVVYSTKSMGRIWKHIDGYPYPYFNINTNVYMDSNLTRTNIVINQGYVDDVPVIQDTGKSAKILVGGYEGWVNKDASKSEYDLILVPLNQVVNPSYYVSENGVLKHFISRDLRNSSKPGDIIEIGVAPSFMEPGVRYFSYDGKYFYNGRDIVSGLDKLISDLQNNTNVNAVNKDNPYYTYFNYLPFRSKTNYSASDIDRFISAKTSGYNSKLKGTGQYFINAQNSYGVNALLALGIAINESGWGKSSIALEKNNIFGLNAIDSNPGGAADTFLSVSDCINEFAKHHISRAYADPTNFAYYGGFLGNKNMGANVKYASDPYWGEKATQFAFMADRFLSNNNLENLKDHNYYQLGMYNSANTVKNGNGTTLYNVYNYITDNVSFTGTTFVITSNNGSTYEINPERTTPVSQGRYHGNYNFDDRGFISSNGVTLINKKSSNAIVNQWVMEDGKYYYYNSDGNIHKGWLALNGEWYYLDPKTGVMKTGWYTEGNDWYYLWNNGSMATGWVKVDGYWYYLNSNGKMARGWTKVGSSWYYLWNGGSMATGWVKIDGIWYYMYDSGEMSTGWVKDGEYWYYMYSSGAMATGWVKVDSYWYYMYSGGSMATGWVLDGSKWYYMHSSGVMATGWVLDGGKWYYMNASGVMETGWIQDGGKWYYLQSNGVLA